MVVCFPRLMACHLLKHAGVQVGRSNSAVYDDDNGWVLTDVLQVYITKQVSFRNRVLILFDWLKARVFGRYALLPCSQVAVGSTPGERFFCYIQSIAMPVLRRDTSLF
jgi:hypothetical protein